MARLSQTKGLNQKYQFDPNKSYKWEPTDIFELTGQQFAVIYHMMNEMVTQPGGAAISRIIEANKVVSDIFLEGIDQGVIVEQNMDTAAVKELFTNKKINNEEGDKEA